jgi:hypothetical protein
MPRYSLFMQHIIGFLMPYFADTAADLEATVEEILQTLASYGARTRAETLKAAQIIALSMTTLEALAEAKSADLSPSLRVRYLGCANSLNRSTLQHEKTLEKRLASDIPDQTVAEPANDLPDHQVEAAIDFARAQIVSYRDRLPAARPAGGSNLTQPRPDMATLAGVMMSALSQGGLQPGPAPVT